MWLGIAMCMKIFINGWRPTSNVSLHMIFRKLFIEAMCTVILCDTHTLCLTFYIVKG